jgi:glutamate racemase
VVVACNTATCYAIAHLRATFTVPFIGTVPAVKPACALTRRGVVGIISTPATARSPALAALIREHGRGVRVIRRGCPGLEELVESGGINGSAVSGALRKHLAPLIRAKVDVLVLGCTHYPFLAPSMRSIAPVRTVDSGRAIARRTKAVLVASGSARTAGNGGVSFFTTGSAKRFSAVASVLLKTRVQARKARI